jgi:hypothetical protein
MNSRSSEFSSSRYEISLLFLLAEPTVFIALLDKWGETFTPSTSENGYNRYLPRWTTEKVRTVQHRQPEQKPTLVEDLLKSDQPRYKTHERPQTYRVKFFTTLLGVATRLSLSGEVPDSASDTFPPFCSRAALPGSVLQNTGKNPEHKRKKEKIVTDLVSKLYFPFSVGFLTCGGCLLDRTFSWLKKKIVSLQRNRGSGQHLAHITSALP